MFVSLMLIAWTPLLLATPSPPPAASPPPPPRSAFCARYHPIHDNADGSGGKGGGVYDPAGPLLDKHGVWHTWEDDGGWSHWTSTDLIHWHGSLNQSTNFSGGTGAVSPTPSGVYAFWPELSPGTIDKGAIYSARATNESMTQWVHRGLTIPMPARITTGYRDPMRAFTFNSKWYAGVGCGNNESGAQLCLFEATDDSLTNFTDRGSLFTTNVTFGKVDENIVWQPTNVSANSTSQGP
jgi:sucrose-6-phosphate hydrolase SacC (GH32 family)